MNGAVFMKYRNKIIALCCVALMIVIGGEAFMQSNNLSFIQSDKQWNSPKQHSQERKHKVGDVVRDYFSGTTALKLLVRKRFDGDVINNIDKIRFDAPVTAEFEIDPHLQYFQPYPVGAGKPYKGFTLTEVFPESKVIYTFGNKHRRSERITKFNSVKYNVFEGDYPNQDVLAIVTHVRPEMCFEPKGGWKAQPVNILPWPQRMENEEDIIEIYGDCMMHPEGWLYYAHFVYVADYQDVLNSRKGNKK